MSSLVELDAYSTMQSLSEVEEEFNYYTEKYYFLKKKYFNGFQEAKNFSRNFLGSSLGNLLSLFASSRYDQRFIKEMKSWKLSKHLSQSKEICFNVAEISPTGHTTSARTNKKMLLQ